MSIGVGTLQPKTRVIRPIWMGGILAVVAALAVAVAITNDPIEQTISTESRYSGTAANTPSELRGGLATSANAGTLANTPTELRGGLAGSFVDALPAIVPHVPRRTAEAASFGVTLGTTTPSELRGGFFEAPSSAYVPIVVNGTVCHQCR